MRIWSCDIELIERLPKFVLFGSFILIQLLCSCSSAVRYSSSNGEIFKGSGTGVYSEIGFASYYSRSFVGKTTASGEIYNPNRFTAAHRTLPFGTKIQVTCLENDRKVVVKVNDRGPFVSGRIIDLSESAAKELGIIEKGIAKVKIEILE